MVIMLSKEFATLLEIDISKHIPINLKAIKMGNKISI